MKKRLLLLLFIFTICLTLPITSYSLDNEVVKVAWYEISGFQDYDDEGNPTGYNYEYLEAIEARSNLEFEYVNTKWEDVFNMLENGEVDIIGGIALTKEGINDYEYCKLPNGTSSIMLITKKFSDISYNDFNALNGKKIGVVASDYRIKMFNDFKERKGFNAELVLCDNNEEMLGLLDSGEIEAAIEVSMYSFSGYKIVAQFDMMPFYFITKKTGNEDIMNDISDAIAEINVFDSELKNELTEKYFTGNNKIGFTIQENDYAESKNTLRIGIKIGRKVLGYIDDETGEIEGIDADIAKAIGRYCGMNVDLIPVEKCSSSQEFLDQNGLDLLIGATELDESSASTKLIPYMEERREFVIKRNGILSEDISYTKVAIPNNAMKTREAIASLYPNWEIVENETEECLNSVLLGSVDAAVISKYELEYYMQMPKYEELDLMPNMAFIDDKTIVISENEPHELYTLISKSIDYLSQRDINYLIYENIADIDYEYTYADIIAENILQILLVLLIIGIAILVYLYDNNLKVRRANWATEKALNEAVVSKNEALEANSVKSDFLSRMSHDMRTPMSTVIGLSDFGIQESTEDNIKGYFKQIRESSEYLLGLLNDILDMQSIEYGGVKLVASSVNLLDLIKESLNMVKPLGDKKGIKINCIKKNVNENDYIVIDRLRLSQVINNILSNAIKYTDNGGVVDCTVELYSGSDGALKLKCSIKDDGVGISEEFLSKLFEPFSQEKNNLTSSGKGTGLGLAISKNLVELMGGHIECKSELEKGSEFIFEIPTSYADSIKVGLENKKILNKNIERLENKRILLCEDNEINARILTKILINKEMIVDWAKTGREGVDKALEDNYDIILMDIRMPVMDGLEAAVEIRKEDKDVPIIALSANAYSKDIERSIKAGMNAHLAKPVIHDELFETMLKFIK